MDTAAAQVAPRKKRRWVVHVVWLAFALSAFGGGLALGFRWCGMALSGMTSTNTKANSFALMRISLDALESGDLAKFRHANAVVLYDAVVALSYLPRYADCSDRDRSYLARASSWLDSHPFAYGHAFDDERKHGATFCDNAKSTWMFP